MALGFEADEVADRVAMLATGAAFRPLEGVFLLAGLVAPPTLMEGSEGISSLTMDEADEGASGSRSRASCCVVWRRSARQLSKKAAARAAIGVDMDDMAVSRETHRLATCR